MKHTPGPWNVPCNQNGEAIQLAIMYGGEYGQHIATVCGPGAGATRESMKANARLIAVAPDLLAICKGLKEDLRSYIRGDISLSDILTPFEEVIAQAEGE